MEYKIKDDLDFIKNETKMSNAQLAEAIGVSLRTIINMGQGKIAPTYNSLDRLYSYIYDKHYRINHVKEEIIQEEAKNKVLFHGSKFGLKEITPKGSREDCDFGSGFYLGESYSQAASFVYETNASSVYVFEGDFAGLEKMEFGCEEDWMLAVCYYRGMLDLYKESEIIKNIMAKVESADIIVAPIADNKMYYVMRKFGDGEITTMEAKHALSESSLGQQYILRSQKAIDRLKFKSRMFLSTSERKQFDTIMDERGKEIDTKLKLSQRLYRGKGKYVEEIFVWENLII